MLLPKPKAVSMPVASSPVGLGLGACNSGNVCGSQTCDNHSSDSDDSCGWSLFWGGVSIVGTAAAAAL